MISPAGMAIAALTVMLWILWSDSIRRRPNQIIYAVRIALYLIVSGILILNMVRYPNLYAASTRAVTIVTVLVGIGGAVYFARKLVRR
jgi:uncharacterized membrane protein YczE